MNKVLTSLLVTAAVLAVMIPAAAGAAPLTESGGATTLAKGAKITGTSTNTKTKTGLGTLSCKEVKFFGEVTKNEGTTAEAVGTGESSGTECEIEGTLVPVTDFTVISLTTTSPTGTGTATFTFKAKIGALNCTYAATNAPFTFSTTMMSNKISFTNVTVAGSPAACNPATFSGDEFLTTSTIGANIELT